MAKKVHQIPLVYISPLSLDNTLPTKNPIMILIYKPYHYYYRVPCSGFTWSAVFFHSPSMQWFIFLPSWYRTVIVSTNVRCLSCNGFPFLFEGVSFFVWEVRQQAGFPLFLSSLVTERKKGFRLFPMLSKVMTIYLSPISLFFLLK